MQVSTGALRYKAPTRPNPISRKAFKSDDEYMSQPFPPAPYKTANEFGGKLLPEEMEEERHVAGDSFGTSAKRVPFLRPKERGVHADPLFAELFTGRHPNECFNPNVVRALKGKLGLPEVEVVRRLIDAGGNTNLFLHDYETDTGKKLPPKSYGLVALEAYDPECFCMLSVSCDTYEQTQDDDVLDAIHEVVLSAAELPLDMSRNAAVDKLREWTTEDDSPCVEVLEGVGLGLVDCILLPYGEYSAQGFFVLDPVKEDSPNIGTAVGTCALDLRSGIHNMFRFHVERVADSVAEHVVREQLHFGQLEHILTQPYWFKPSYSVEEMLRFKERLLEPSANLFELRYAVLHHHFLNLPGYRNLVELEKLKHAQLAHDKHFEDFLDSGDSISRNAGTLHSEAGAAGATSGGSAYREGTTPGTDGEAYAAQADTFRMMMTRNRGLLAQNDRFFSHLYKNNFH